ncbi:hypothetical protein RXV95_04630 [Novosphingobium sp. ZN18A2]|uniref:hypothetical protein n=1 Tax=Novosphingobium sp. ZN18A2 TaxID=3079861 RepID=UPI0030CF5726
MSAVIRPAGLSRHAAAPICALAVLAALSACGRASHGPQRQDFDPAMTAAIEAPIMVDPDLSLQNARFAALSPGGPADGSLPMFDNSESERQAAYNQALALAGGRLRSPPSPGPASGHLAAIAGEITLIGRARRITAAPDCVAGANPGMIWGARLPASLPAYPRAHLREAWGNAKRGCELRAASFMSGAKADDVLSFYATMASRGGFALALSQDAGGTLLEGRRKTDRARFGVLVRPGPKGAVLIDVVTLNA